jgi:hypothetical protein
MPFCMALKYIVMVSQYGILWGGAGDDNRESKQLSVMEIIILGFSSKKYFKQTIVIEKIHL